MRKDYHFYLDENKDNMLECFINDKSLWKDCGSRSAFIRKLLYMAKESFISGRDMCENTTPKKDVVNNENENLFSSLISMMK